MKKFLVILLSVLLALSTLTFTACKKVPDEEQGNIGQDKEEENKPSDNKPSDDNPSDDNPNDEPSDTDPDEGKDDPAPQPDDQEETDPTPQPDPQPKPQPQPQPQPDEGSSEDDDKCLGESIEQGFIMQAYNNAVMAFANGMGKLSSAKNITRKITVQSGELLVYSLSERYQASSGAFSWTCTEKTLNDLGGEDAYTTQEKSETKDSVSFSKALAFSLKDFRDMPTLSFNLDEVEGQFSKNIAKRIFGVEENISTVDIHMKRAGNNVTYALISFTFENYTITIEIVATY